MGKMGDMAKRERRGVRLAMLAEDPACFYCRCPLTEQTATIDHFMPRCLEGGDHPQNLRLACAQCNHAKGGEHPDVWLGTTAHVRPATIYRRVRPARRWIGRGCVVNRMPCAVRPAPDAPVHLRCPDERDRSREFRELCRSISVG